VEQLQPFRAKLRGQIPARTRKRVIRMKLNEVVKVEQTADKGEVNDLLAKGYRILKIFSTKVTTDAGEFVQPCYVLGLKQEQNKQVNDNGV